MAGKTGQHDHLKPIIDALSATPANFSFAQAVELSRLHLRGKAPDAPKGVLRYTVNPSLAFPPSDVESLEFKSDGGGDRAEFMLNLMGLHGAGSPVPAYFTEHVAKHQDEDCALREFLNIFNHHLVELLYGTWFKYRYPLQYEENAADKLSQRFFSFAGLGHKKLRAGKNLNWARILAYMGLISFKSDASGSLESILRYYFGHSEVEIVPCVQRKVSIPLEQRCALGLENASLGVDCMLGEALLDQTGKFRVRISNLSWKRFNSFLPCADIFKELQSLMGFVLRSRLHFDVELRLKPEEIKPLHLSEKNVCRLGWSSWIGENGDGIVVLETNTREAVA